MPAQSLALTELPGTSRLVADFGYDFPRVSTYYHLSPFDPASYPAAAGAIDYPAERRAALVEALAEQNPGHPALDALAGPRTLVVATGQQVGLFGGPAYTLYKALTAARLARALTDRGLPSVAVFWMATEDHDLAEVSRAWVFDAANQPVKIEAGSGGVSQQPVGPVPIGPGPLDALRRALEGLPFAGEVLGLAEQAYEPGRSYGAAFHALLSRLLSAYGVLFLDPLRPALRRLPAPLLAGALKKIPGLVRQVIARSLELEARGYHAQVRVDETSSLLFVLEDGRRLPLRLGNGAAAEGPAPERLSPNALLRPVVQNYIMPVVAAVMGPAEVSYMAQAEVLHRELLGRMPVIVPRASFSLMDARSAKLMDRYGLALTDVARGEESLKAVLAEKLVPAWLAGRIEETKRSVEESLERLQSGLADFDPTLAEAAARSRRKILYQAGKIERKAGREMLRRDGRAGEEAGHLARLLCPERQLQERFYSILPFLAKHGTGLLETIYGRIRLGSPDHRMPAV
ncbi:MAG: bacillithiol biosynthesis cysteine-adding enzyme BshC [Bryobacterales bacterium]|nr:bacillithiol biosynthesis cysteine-adding enzyme BshC [Bryobacterales bacterium]